MGPPLLVAREGSGMPLRRSCREQTSQVRAHRDGEKYG
jgi:hypothetical protein